MDSRKRPRSETPSFNTYDSSPTKRKIKSNKSKTKKNKKHRSNSLTGETSSLASGTNKNSMESTATAEGQIMAQMLSTFSKLEQSRFEAFQRTSFALDAIGDWVAACLSQHYCLPPTSTAATGQKRSLEDLVAVGQAGEIRTVVAVLAKIYAQRLVQTASRMAATASNNNNSIAGNSTMAMDVSLSGGGGGSTAFTPEDILRAYNQRKAQGLDPGFFLQQVRELPWSFALDSKDAFELRRLAALEAQEEFDRQYPEVADAEDATTNRKGYTAT